MEVYLCLNGEQVDNAVRSCLEYVATRKVPFDTFSEASEAQSKFSSGKCRLLQQGLCWLFAN